MEWNSSNASFYLGREAWQNSLHRLRRYRMNLILICDESIYHFYYLNNWCQVEGRMRLNRSFDFGTQFHLFLFEPSQMTFVFLRYSSWLLLHIWIYRGIKDGILAHVDYWLFAYWWFIFIWTIIKGRTLFNLRQTHSISSLRVGEHLFQFQLDISHCQLIAIKVWFKRSLILRKDIAAFHHWFALFYLLIPITGHYSTRNVLLLIYIIQAEFGFPFDKAGKGLFDLRLECSIPEWNNAFLGCASMICIKNCFYFCNEYIYFFIILILI
jgi:hypothetical protein